MTPHEASVIMINRNGGSALAGALGSCRADLEACWQQDPCFELLVVDNGSIDDSWQVIHTALAGAPFPWRAVSEPTPGVNFSRNAGLRAACGQLLIFTDSDLKFRQGWLRAYLAAARETPAVAVFGGRVHVGTRPPHVPEWVDLTGPYRRTCIIVQSDYGNTRCVLPLTGSAGPVGPNMAFRRDLFDRFGEFDTRFGLRPGSLVAGAESEFFDRLARAGLEFLYVPDAAVDHPVRASQLSRRYFLRRLHGTGRVLARTQRLRGLRSRQVFGVRFHVLRQLLRAALQYGAALIQPCVKRRFFYRGQLSVLLGHVHEDFRQWWALQVSRTYGGSVYLKRFLKSAAPTELTGPGAPGGR